MARPGFQKFVNAAGAMGKVAPPDTAKDWRMGSACTGSMKLLTNPPRTASKRAWPRHRPNLLRKSNEYSNATPFLARLGTWRSEDVGISHQGSMGASAVLMLRALSALLALVWIPVEQPSTVRRVFDHQCTSRMGSNVWMNRSTQESYERQHTEDPIDHEP